MSKLNFKRGIATATLVVSLIGTMPNNVYAEELMNHKEYTKPIQGTFITEPLDYEESQYLRYVVKKGDTMAKISEKVCKYFGIEISSKYWPAITYLNLNGKMRISNKPGDILLIPGTPEDLILLQAELDELGWTSDYKYSNDVYGTRKHQIEVEGISLGALLNEIYGKKVCVDDDFRIKFLKAIGLSTSYGLDFMIKDNNTYFRFTEYLPSLEELGYEQPEDVITLK